MSSILNEGMDDGDVGGGGRVNYLSGGYDDGTPRVRRASFKQMLFKLVNLMTFHNVVTNTFYIILLLIEFAQFLGFVFYKVNIAATTTSGFAQSVAQVAATASGSTSNQSSLTTTQHILQLAYVSYFNMKQALMDIRSSVDSPEAGQTASYVIEGLALFIILINFFIVACLCKYAKDGYDALFASPLTKMMLKLCGVIQIVFVQILFLPLLMILVSVLICTKDVGLAKPNSPLPANAADNDLLLQYYFGGYQCWTIPHIVLTIICMFFAIAMAGLTALVALLFNDVRFHSELPWGNASTKAQLLKTVIKILIAIALHIEMYDRWALLVCQCANVILVYLLLHARWKFFYMSDRKVMIVTVLQEGAYLWLSFLVTMVNAAQLDTLSYSLFAYLIISALAFALLVLTAFLNSKDSHYMLFRLPHLKHDYEFEQFFLRLQRHVQDSKVGNIDKIVVYGLLKDHQRNAVSRCTDPKCHCEQLFYLMSKNKLEAHLSQLHEMAEEKQRLIHRDDPKYNFKKVEQTKRDLDAKQLKRYEYKFRRLFFKFFYSLLTKRIDAQFPKSMRLKFLQVQVLQHELSNEFKSYFQILKLLRDKPPLEYQYFLYQSKQSVEHIMYRKYQTLLSNKQTIDVMKVYDFEQLFIRFEKQIVNTANNCLNFWKELMDKRLDVNRIHDFGVQISNSYSEVNDITQQMLSLFPQHVMFQRIYASFLGDVMNNENEAYEINARVRSQLESANNMHKLNYMNEDKFFGYNTGTVIITITVTPRDIGNIVNANFETKKLLGYRHKELKGKNVRSLMPKILQDNHDSFIQAYFETAKAKILEVQRIVIGKDKDGYIVPLHILVKAIPNLKRNLTFVGFLRKLDENDAFLQPPSQYNRLDYHLIVADLEGQIYGFTRNCWETFGFKPAFFFNQFGDPEQQIRMEFIIKSLKDPQFQNKPELKREGVFCALDTGVVMENAPRELLSKEEQDLMMNISGSYNINLQIEDMSFANDRITLRVYKIVKHSRIIRSQNAFDAIGNRSTTGAGLPVMSFESQEIDSNLGESVAQNRGRPGKRPKFVNKRMNSDIFDDARPDGDDVVNPDDIQLGEDAAGGNGNGGGNRVSLYESSGDGGSSSSAAHSQSQQLINFKKQISTREMPASIIKLNRLVLCIVLVILAVVIFDTAQNYQYYKFSEQSHIILQNLFHKHYLISKISANIITMGLINMGLQNDTYLAFTNRRSSLRDKLLSDIEDLELIEDSIQNAPGATSYGLYGLSGGQNIFDPNPPMTITLLNQDASLLFDNAQTMRYAVSQLISKVGSLLQLPQSFRTIYLPPEQSLIQQMIMNNGTSPAIDRNDTLKSVFFIVYNSLRDLTTVTLNQLDAFNTVAFNKSEDLNHWLLVSSFVFFCVFVVMSGFVIFPIVMGVQRNKVMILSIYFELPQPEIKSVHKRCYQFLCKIDDERRNEAMMMAAASGDDGQYNAEESKYDYVDVGIDGSGMEGEGGDDSAMGEDPDFTKRDSSRVSNRGLVDQSMRFQRQKKKRTGTVGESQVDEKAPKTGIMKPGKKTNTNAPGKKVEDVIKAPNPLNNTQQNQQNNAERRDSENSKGENEEEEKDNSLDHNKMLKDIKISNNKLNMVTLSVIVVFLTYFSTCFGVSLNYLNSIRGQVETNTKLYSEQPALEYTYLYFLTDILLDNAENTEEEMTRYSKKVTQMYQLLDAREDAKRGGVQWLRNVDNQTFCQVISPYLDTDFERQQCPTILDGQFRLGYRSSVFSFMYQFQQLRVQYDLERNKTGRASLITKRNMLNDPAFQKFSVISNAYYQAQMQGLNVSLTQTMADFVQKAILFVQLRIIFFIAFTFTIFAFLWRVFLRNIQAEVFRSKGMLNMIPTAFLEKDNNLKKLSLNKLVNLG